MDDPETSRLDGAIRRELGIHRIMGIVAAFILLAGAAYMGWQSFACLGVVLSEIEAMHGHIVSFCVSLVGAAMLLVLAVLTLSFSFEENATRRMALKLAQRVAELEKKQEETESERVPGTRR